MTLLLCLLLIFCESFQSAHLRKIREESMRKYALPNLELKQKVPMFSGLRSRA